LDANKRIREENKMRHKAGIVFLSAVTLAAAEGPAIADHGKAGLWVVTTTVRMTGSTTMQQTFSSQHCMTAEEVKSDSLPQNSENKLCKLTDQHRTGNTLSAQMVCSGEAESHGTMTVTYDGDAHYTGSLSMTTESGGQSIHTTNSFEGKWVSADCGIVTD
jgi:Protein of unknown function (DUF3617)